MDESLFILANMFILGILPSLLFFKFEQYNLISLTSLDLNNAYNSY